MKRITEWIMSAETFRSERFGATMLAMRLCASLLLIPFGTGKIRDYDALCVNFFDDPIGLGMELSLVLTIAVQIGGSVLLALGCQTRLAALVLAFHMGVATKYHFFDPIGKMAFPAIFLAVFLLIAALGAGRYSVDAWCMRRFAGRGVVLSRRERVRTAVILASFAVMWFCFDNRFGDAVTLLLLALGGGALIWAYADAPDGE